MNNQKNLISILLIIGLVVVGAFLIKSNKSPVSSTADQTNTGVLPETPDTTSGNDTGALPPPVVKSSAWDVFQQYVGYLKTHNVAGVKTVVSQNILDFYPTCPMRPVAEGASCDALMDLAYSDEVKLKKADYVNTMEDGKQVILSTNANFEKADPVNSADSYRKSYLYFTKDANGVPKFLAAYSILTTFVFQDYKGATAADKAQRVTKSFTDADKDGLLDKYESCVTNNNEVASIYNPRCSTTSPTKRDSQGDGWLDGIRVFFGHK